MTCPTLKRAASPYASTIAATRPSSSSPALPVGATPHGALLGEDPRVEQERRRQTELRRQARTFASVCEEYFADIKRRNLRCASELKLIYGLKVPC